jgi:hypothetical protein
MSYGFLAFHTDFGTIASFINTKQLKTNCLIQCMFGFSVAFRLMAHLYSSVSQAVGKKASPQKTDVLKEH